MSLMRRLASLILLLCYGFVFFNVNTALAFGPVAKVKVTHSHEHGSDHHHHDSPSNETDGKKPASNPHGGNQHSHEVSVGAQVIIAPNDLPAVRAVIVTDIAKFSQKDVRVPKSPALLGIFRPPIA